MQITEQQNRAAGDFVDLIATRLGSGRAIHPETAIASSARISGSLLLRSFSFDLDSQEPGTILLSNEANEQGPDLVNLLGAFLARNRVALDSTMLGGAPEHRGTQPNLDIQKSLALLQTDALQNCCAAFTFSATSRGGGCLSYRFHRQGVRRIGWRGGWLQCRSFRIH